MKLTAKGLKLLAILCDKKERAGNYETEAMRIEVEEWATSMHLHLQSCLEEYDLNVYHEIIKCNTEDLNGIPLMKIRALDKILGTSLALKKLKYRSANPKYSLYLTGRELLKELEEANEAT